MLSALKKLTVNNNKQDCNNVATPSGLQTMPRMLQSKFSKGVQYNMKIIIKGDRNVGKTCLFNRLQGRGFIETYTQTEEIQVASIQWNYKATDDVVKVEVWDVVDKGKKRVISENLKLGNKSNQEIIEPALDAEFLNVYKGTNGVILMMDITKNWTFEYVQRELGKIPASIPVLVLGNHCDMSHHRVTTPDHVLFYLETFQRIAPVRYAESSMSNGFGLKFLHKWFNLPFLQLQRETLLTQLATNENEINITTQELDLYQQTDDSNYKVYLERLTSYRRKVAEYNSSIPTTTVVIQTQHNFPVSIATKDDTSKLLSNANKSQPGNSSVNNIGNISLSSIAKEIKPVILPDEKGMPLKSNFDNQNTIETPVPAKLNESIRNIEEFIPDDYLDKSFLEDSNTNLVINKLSPTSNESDSEPETSGNPLVSEFQDDLDPEDVFSAQNITSGGRIVSSVCNLESCMSAESRGSPDGGDDISKSTNNDSKIALEEKLTNEKKKKKISKKRIEKQPEDLENFLNSEYEAL